VKAWPTPRPARSPTSRRKSCPRAQKGENVLVAAHGNSLRAIVMDLEKLTSEADQ